MFDTRSNNIISDKHHYHKMNRRWKVYAKTITIIVSCFLLYSTLPYSSHQLGENVIQVVKEPKKRESQSSRIDDSISTRHLHSPSSFAVRVKRQTQKNPEKIFLSAKEMTKSSQQIQFTPSHGYFYGAPGSINSYQSDQQSTPILSQSVGPTINSRSPFSAFVPAFLPYQNQQQQPIVDSKTSLNGPSMQLACFLGPESSQFMHLNTQGNFHCTYLPAPLTFQFPEIPGITDLNQGFNDNAKDIHDHSDLVQARHNPFENIFKELVRDCPVNHYRCNDGSKCIPKLKWCDSIVDCFDASDEIKCSCRERIGRDRICDNYPDCPHGEDELGCSGCPKNSFSCQDSEGSLYKNEGCISMKERCDGISQCNNGKDEQHCNILAETYVTGTEMFPVGYNVGYLQRNLKGKWYPVCGRAYSWAKDACEAIDGPINDNEIEVEMVISRLQQDIGQFLFQDSYGGSKLISECRDQITYVRCPKYSDKGSFIVTSKASEVGSSNLTDPMVSIVGGHDSSPGSWPFIVAINKNGNFHCGGAILNEWWILSAAHCFADPEHQYYEIDAGMLRRFSYSPAHQKRQLDGVITHQKFNPMYLTNDIALGLLSEQLFFNKWVKPVPLPKPDKGLGLFGWGQEPSPGTICIAVGWGALNEGGADPDHLREVEVPIINCKHREDRNIAEICAGLRQGGRDACQGDSGGPLMCRKQNSDSDWYIGGIVSHGVGCGRRNEPGAYTKVSHFVDWINSVINGHRTTSPLTRTRSTCPGFSCNHPYSKCLSPKRRCDKVVDCLEAEDEFNCPSYRTFDQVNQETTSTEIQ